MSEEVAEQGSTDLGTNTAMDSAEAEARLITANNSVKNHIIASMAVGLVPLPMFDMAALTSTQMNMLRSLSEHYDVSFEDTDMKSLLMTLLSGSLPVLGVVGLSSFAKLIPGVGTLAGGASLSLTSGAVTYAVGQTFIMHFEAGGTFEDFDPKQAQAFFKREIEAGKAFVQSIKDDLSSEEIPQDDDVIEAAPKQASSDAASTSTSSNTQTSS